LPDGEGRDGIVITTKGGGTMHPRRIAACCALLGTLAAGASHAQAPRDDYPNKPIRLIVPFAPGGGTDIVARVLAQKLTESFRQSVIVDNRAGGGGTIGAETAVRATPDGYTMIMVSGSYATNAAVYNLPYDPVNDITPVALIGDTGFVIALHPGVPIRTVKELIDHAKSNPGKLNYGSTGTGGITHLASELFVMMAGAKMTHIPYKGTGPALNDLLGGQIQLMFGSMPATVPHIKSNRLRGIAVTTLKRSNALPDVPTAAETVPDYEVALWYAAWGPKGLPPHVVGLWNREINSVVHSQDMKDRMAGEGLEPAGGPPERFREVLKRDVAKWTQVVRSAGIKPER
jgi:tripartite-type tricarboxylate transporter receptor subunit TctC